MIRLPLPAVLFTFAVVAHQLPGQDKAGKDALPADTLKSTLTVRELKPPEVANAKGAYAGEIARDQYRAWVLLFAITGGRLLYRCCRGAEIQRPAEMPATFWKGLLTANDTTSTTGTYWTYRRDDRMVQLVRFIPNRGLTAAALRKEIYSFHAEVKK